MDHDNASISERPTEATKPPPPPPPSGPPTHAESAVSPTSRSGYRSAGRLTVGLQLAFVGSIAASAFQIASIVRASELVDRLELSPQAVTSGELDAVDHRTMVISLVGLAFTITGFGFVIAVARRLYRNASSLSNYPLRFSEGWAVGAWFIPLLNFVRPKQIVDDIWRATAPDQSPCSPPSRHKVSALLHVWWASVIISSLATRADDEAASGTPADIRDALLQRQIVCVLLIAAAALTMVVGVRLVARDSRRANLILGLGSPSSEDLVPRLLATAAVAVVAAGIALVAFAPNATAESDKGAGVMVGDLVAGDCFDYPSTIDPDQTGDSVVTVVGVAVRPCDEPHDAEVFAVVRHPAGANAKYPGKTAVFEVGDRLCLNKFERSIGTRYEESALGIFVFVPQDSWALGDRAIQCIAGRDDGVKLSDTVISSGL